MKKHVIAIVMCDNNNAIGRNGTQPIFLKNDLELFSCFTKDQIVVYGRKTLEALPNQKPLKSRINIILSKSLDLSDQYPDMVCHSINEVLEKIDSYKKYRKVYIIGGASIFNSFHDYIDELNVTKVDTIFENADTFLPKNFFNGFHCVSDRLIKDIDQYNNKYDTYHQLYFKDK